MDRRGKDDFLQFVNSFGGGLLIISHDRKLLESVDVILELSNRGLTKFGGNWQFYEEQSRLERERLKDGIRKNQRAVSKSMKQRNDLLARQEKRSRHGKVRAKEKGLSKIEVSGMKRQSQITLSKVDCLTLSKYKNAITSAQNSLANLKVTPQIYADFPETEIENSKLIFEAQNLNFRYAGSNKELWANPINLCVRGSLKVALEGKNGAGKSTFLKLLLGNSSPLGHQSGQLRLGKLNHGYLDQSLEIIEIAKTVLENVMFTTKKDLSTVRNLLAQFLFSGDKVNQIAGTLSGGEKLRLALAKTLLSDPAPQLLILDEPTNNIDISNLQFLESALANFKGAVIVASHDLVFLENLGIDVRINLETNAPAMHL